MLDVASDTRREAVDCQKRGRERKCPPKVNWPWGTSHAASGFLHLAVRSPWPEDALGLNMGLSHVKLVKAL